MVRCLVDVALAALSLLGRDDEPGWAGLKNPIAEGVFQSRPFSGVGAKEPPLLGRLPEPDLGRPDVLPGLPEVRCEL